MKAKPARSPALTSDQLRINVVGAASFNSFVGSCPTRLHPFVACLFGEIDEGLFQLVEVFLLELLEIEQFVAGVPHRAYQFIELHLDSFGIAVLRALDQKYHQERDDRRPRIDHELPCVAESERWPESGPYEDDTRRQK